MKFLKSKQEAMCIRNKQSQIFSDDDNGRWRNDTWRTTTV